jgi:hypothetical protein
MNKKLCVSAVSVVLAACGSSGGGGDSVPTEPVAVAVVQLPDVSFVNVLTDPRNDSVIPGEIGIEVLAFRVQMEGRTTPIEQLVFTVKAKSAEPVQLQALFKKIRLMTSAGDDIRFSEASYTVRFDEKNSRIIVNFDYQWIPASTGVVPRTYSLVADMTPGAKADTAFSFELYKVQTHDADKTMSLNVAGATFAVKPVAGMELPVVTSASPASFAATSDLGSKAVPMGSIKVFCPADNKKDCTLQAVATHACGMSNPVIRVDGVDFWSGQTYMPDQFSFNTFFGWIIHPGETKMLSILATPYNSNLRINVLDVVMTIGEEPVQVSPIITVGSDPNNVLVPDTKECPSNGKG